jgi:hypothetical protein
MTQAKAAAEKPKVERKDNVIDVAKPAVKTEINKPAESSKPAVAAVAS